MARLVPRRVPVLYVPEPFVKPRRRRVGLEHRQHRPRHAGVLRDGFDAGHQRSTDAPAPGVVLHLQLVHVRDRGAVRVLHLESKVHEPHRAVVVVPAEGDDESRVRVRQLAPLLRVAPAPGPLVHRLHVALGQVEAPPPEPVGELIDDVSARRGRSVGRRRTHHCRPQLRGGAHERRDVARGVGGGDELPRRRLVPLPLPLLFRAPSLPPLSRRVAFRIPRLGAPSTPHRRGEWRRDEVPTRGQVFRPGALPFAANA